MRELDVHAARDAFDGEILSVLCYGFYLVLAQRQVVRPLQSGFGKRVILVLILFGDSVPYTFSALTKKQPKNTSVCYLGYTNDKGTARARRYIRIR